MMVQVNGDETEVADAASIETLLSQLGVARGRLAVEHNLQIVPKSKYGETVLAEGDRVEIVGFVGGG